MFYAGWCEHCKVLMPTWEKLAEIYSHKTNVARFDCSVAGHRDVCIAYKVLQLPTLVFFPVDEDYNTQFF